MALAGSRTNPQLGRSAVSPGAGPEITKRPSNPSNPTTPAKEVNAEARQAGAALISAGAKEIRSENLHLRQQPP